MRYLEVACFNYESAQRTVQSGANRIEFCTNAHLGGTSPNLKDVKRLIVSRNEQQLETPVFVMVRPRGGDFVYSAEEFRQMTSTIEQFKAHVNGFVFGILDASGNVDEARNRQLVQLAEPLPCTFHRAFDVVADQQIALEATIRCGFATILTSAGMANALEGAEKLRDLIAQAASRIEIMPGGGVRSSNIGQLASICQGIWFHSAATTSQDEMANPEEIRMMKSILNDPPPG